MLSKIFLLIKFLNIILKLRKRNFVIKKCSTLFIVKKRFNIQMKIKKINLIVLFFFLDENMQLKKTN